jgi:hypothetical protein
MEFQELPHSTAELITLEELSCAISDSVKARMAAVPGYDLEYTQHIVGSLIGLVYGTHRVYPQVDLEWVHIPEKQNPAGVEFALSVLRETVVLPAAAAAAKMFPPEEGKLEEFERFFRAMCLMVADHLLDPIRFELIPEE